MICQGETDVPLTDRSSTERVRVHLVSPKSFSSLGVNAPLGRVLTEHDERGAARNAVLSYASRAGMLFLMDVCHAEKLINCLHSRPIMFVLLEARLRCEGLRST